MKLSIDTQVLHKRYGDEKAIGMLKEAGFDSIDYSYYWLDESDEALSENYREYAVKVKGWLEEKGMTCNQAHAPFDIKYGCKFDLSEPEYRKIVRSMESASIMGANCIVVHSIIVPPHEDIFTYNLEFYKSLEPYCKEFDIQVAVENLFRVDHKSKCFRGTLFTEKHLNQMIQALDSPYYVVCIDIGHASLTGYEPEDLIKGFDNQTLKALHVQDTDYMDDLHTLPYSGKLDWNAITSALKEMNYNSDFTFEIFNYLNKIEDDFMEDALAYASKIGRYLISKIID